MKFLKSYIAYMGDFIANLDSRKKMFAVFILKLVLKCFLDIPKFKENRERQYFEESFLIAVLGVGS